MAAGAVYYGFDTVDYKDYILGMEKLRGIQGEVMPLFLKHRAESEPYLDQGASFNIPEGLKAEKTGDGAFFTIRYHGACVGYSMFLFRVDLSDAGAPYAEGQGVFIDKDHRKGFLAKQLLDYSADFCRRLGIKYMYMGDQAPSGGVDLELLFKRAGFKLSSRIFLREL